MQKKEVPQKYNVRAAATISDVNKDLGRKAKAEAKDTGHKVKAKAKALGYQGQGQGQGLEMSKPITTRRSADADNRLDAFSGQSRSTNIVAFHMLHIECNSN